MSTVRRGTGPFPVLVFRTPYGKHFAVAVLPHPPEGRRARLCGRAAGCARATRVGRSLRSISKRGSGRLRHHRMGRVAGLVEWQGRHLRVLLSRRRAMACGPGAATAPGVDGAGDDLLLAAELLLHERRVRPVLAAVDLHQRRTGRTSSSRPARNPRRVRGRRRLARGRGRVPRLAPAGRAAAPAARGTVLLRVAGASARRSVVGLGRAARPLWTGVRRGPEPERLVRRGLWSRGRGNQFQRSPGVAHGRTSSRGRRWCWARGSTASVLWRRPAPATSISDPRPRSTTTVSSSTSTTGTCAASTIASRRLRRCVIS